MILFLAYNNNNENKGKYSKYRMKMSDFILYFRRQWVKGVKGRGGRGAGNGNEGLSKRVRKKEVKFWRQVVKMRFITFCIL